MVEQQQQQGSSKPKQSTFKVVLLGESAVGKSSVVTRFVRDQFDPCKESTIGAAFLTKEVKIDDENTATLHIWDTAGQERYKSLAPMYYRNAVAAVVAYDITQSASFEKAKSWVKDLQRQATSSIVIALVGNKTDLEDRRTVATEEGSEYAQEAGLLFFETSAKSGENVNEVFESLTRKIPPANEPKGARPDRVIDLQRQGGGQASAAATDCAC